MAETAALLSDEVFPAVPIRQWVISFPFPLRYLFAAHPQAMGKVLGIVANFSGSLFTLPAGELGFAVGYEHREQDGFFQPDAVVVAGESAGVPSSATSGGYDVDEFFLELNIPILAEAPFANLLAP